MKTQPTQTHRWTRIRLRVCRQRVRSKTKCNRIDGCATAISRAKAGQMCQDPLISCTNLLNCRCASCDGMNFDVPFGWHRRASVRTEWKRDAHTWVTHVCVRCSHNINENEYQKPKIKLKTFRFIVRRKLRTITSRLIKLHYWSRVLHFSVR